MEDASTETASTSSQGWKTQVWNCRAGIRKYKKHKTHNVYIQFVEIVMELSLIMEGN